MKQKTCCLHHKVKGTTEENSCMIHTKGNEKGIKVSLQKKPTKYKRYNTGNKGQES